MSDWALYKANIVFNNLTKLMQDEEKAPVRVEDHIQDHIQGQSTTEIVAETEDRPSTLQSGGQIHLLLGVLIAAICLGLALHSTRFIMDPAASVPRKVWVYSRGNSSHQSLDAYQKDNLEHFATNQGFDVTLISLDNCHQYLSSTSNEQLKLWVERMETRQAQSNFKNKIEEKQYEILLQNAMGLLVLWQNGGVLIEQSLTLTESLNWIYQVDGNPDIVKGSKQLRHQVIAFFMGTFSSPRIKKSTKETNFAPFRYSRQTYGIDDGFIAAVKNAVLIQDICKELEQFLGGNHDFETDYLKDFQRRKEGNEGISRNLWVYSAQQRAFVFPQLVNHLLETKLKHLPTFHFNRALDYYKVALINSLLGPYKMRYQGARMDRFRFFNHLADFTHEELTTYLGPFRYASYLHVNLDGLSSVKNEQRRVMQGSFLTHLFPTAFSNKLYPSPDVYNRAKPGVVWNNLPKKVWVIWTSGLENAPLSNRIAFEVLKSRLANQGSQINLVTYGNLYKFIDRSTYERIRDVVNNPPQRGTRFGTTGPDLLRLALLKMHGGVYLDMGIILQDDLSWIWNIASMPSQYIFNRYGDVPKVLMMTYFYEGGPGVWTIDPIHGTKAFEHMGFDNSFIAAQPGSEFIRDWFDTALRMLTKNYVQVFQAFKQCGLYENTFAEKGGLYPMPMDCASCVLGQKKNFLMNHKLNNDWANAADYYKLWTMNIMAGPMKTREFNNLEEGMERGGYSPYTGDLPEEYVDQIVGKSIVPYRKLVSYQTKETSKVLSQTGKKKKQLHPHSMYAKVMKDSNITLQQKDGEMSVVMIGA